MSPSNHDGPGSIKRRSTNDSMMSNTSVFSWITDSGKTKHKHDVVVYDPLEKRLFCEDHRKLKSKLLCAADVFSPLTNTTPRKRDLCQSPHRRHRSQSLGLHGVTATETCHEPKRIHAEQWTEQRIEEYSKGLHRDGRFE